MVQWFGLLNLLESIGLSITLLGLLAGESFGNHHESLYHFNYDFIESSKKI